MVLSKSFQQVCGLGIASVLMAASPVLAAPRAVTLGPITGEVVLQQGEGFVAAVDGLMLKPGDQVKVGPDSKAEIIFAQPGCSVTVSATSLYVVGETAPCQKGERLAFAGPGFVQPTMANMPNLPTAHMIAFGVAGLGLLGVVLLASGTDEPDPISP